MEISMYTKIQLYMLDLMSSFGFQLGNDKVKKIKKEMDSA